MIAFCHIPKTAGMAVVDVLKYQYGTKCLQTTGWNLGSRYTESALRYDLMVYPKLHCIAGHGIRPFLRLGKISHKFNWFTLLRNPQERIVSHYVYDVKTGRGKWPSLRSWLEDGHDNYQSRWIAGKADAKQAIQIIKEKFISVGLQDHFLESMHHLAVVCHWKRLTCSPTQVNPTPDSEFKNKARCEAQNLSPLIEDLNSEDFKLYNFAKQTIWPKQISELATSEVQITTVPNLEEKVRSKMHDIYRNTFYKPFLFVARKFISK